MWGITLGFILLYGTGSWAPTSADIYQYHPKEYSLYYTWMPKSNVMKLCTRLYILLLLLLTGITYAAPNPPILHLGIEQGLSNNTVRCIIQDHYGFMWFGTYDGLNRYD